MAKIIPETLKPADPILDKVKNIMVGNNTQTALAAIQAAKTIGFNTKLLTTSLHGEASQMGQSLSESALTLLTSPTHMLRPACLIAGGETTVTIKGSGKGGRNQELALGAVKSLSGGDQIILISLATDGGDGPTDAAGAVASNQTYSLGSAMGLYPIDYLDRNDSYHYFEPLGDLIKIGPTLTKVNDLVFIFGV
jgi:glycerate 2-kinase